MKKISVKNFSGFFDIESKFHRIKFSCMPCSKDFYEGINIISGDIDTYGVGISYALSMIMYTKNSILHSESKLIIDDVESDFRDSCNMACFVDERYPLFNNSISVKRNIANALKKSKLDISFDDVKLLFNLSDERYTRPLSQVGNERLRCLAAIGYAYGKSIFCFPWMSKNIMEYYGKNIFGLLDILEHQHKFVILPTNYY